MRERQALVADIVQPAGHQVALPQVLRHVGVTGHGDDFTAFENLVDLLQRVRFVGFAVVELEQGAMGSQDDDLVLRDGCDVLTQPLQLAIAEARVVVVARRAGVNDVAQRHHVGLACLVRVILRPELGAETIELVFTIAGIEVEVVVARQEAGRTVEHGGQVASLREKRQIVAHEVSQEQGPAPGVVCAGCEVGKDTVARESDLLLVVGLDIGTEHAVLFGRLSEVALDHREVHLVRQGACGGYAPVLQGGGAGRQVVVEELRDVVLVYRHLVSAWLGDEDGHVVECRQFVATLPIGGNDLPAVGDGNSRHAGLTPILGGVSVLVVEDNAIKGRFFGSRCFDDLDAAPVGCSGPTVLLGFTGRTLDVDASHLGVDAVGSVRDGEVVLVPELVHRVEHVEDVFVAVILPSLHIVGLEFGVNVAAQMQRNRANLLIVSGRRFEGEVGHGIDASSGRIGHRRGNRVRRKHHEPGRNLIRGNLAGRSWSRRDQRLAGRIIRVDRVVDALIRDGVVGAVEVVIGTVEAEARVGRNFQSARRAVSHATGEDLHEVFVHDEGRAEFGIEVHVSQ